MSSIFIFGATGGVGSRLAPMLVEQGHTVRGLHRQSEQATQLKAQGVTPVKGDIMLMEQADFTTVTQGCDVLVFSAGAAGSGLERTAGIDGQGVIKMIEAAKANGIKRVYLVSAFMDAGRDKPRKDGFEFYMRTKREADNALVASQLDWVIVRPGTLVTEDGDGMVNANYAIPYGNVARGNVAKTLAKLIDTPQICREIIEITDGDIPVDKAINALVR